MGALVPYEPLNVLKPVAPEVWIVDGPEIRFHYLGLRLPFNTRMTLVRLKDGGLFVHSPVALTAALGAAVDALGPVRALIAPNSIHYWWIPDWKARYPRAPVFGVPRQPRKARRRFTPDAILGDAPPAAWAAEIGQVLLRGRVIDEADFFHGASRTLILTDLIENFEPARVKNRLFRLLVRAFHAADPDGSAPYDMRASFDRRAIRPMVERMIAWNPERVILAHGRWYDTGGAAELRCAFDWVLR
ncbi:MAG TPA: DUF4336 domain-containing protein [Rhizomicrobium sp.]|nr:DUF4336 domain-containing protein [Rhizomicrobium sp.]